MGIYRSSDSLSSCSSESFAHLYDARIKGASKPPEEVRSIPRDTLEISKEKLKEEALSRLRHTTKQTIAYTGFLRIGKTLFLCAALPPYFLFYGLPKWMLLQTAALFSQFVPWLFRPIQKTIQEKKERILQTVVAVKKSLEQIVQRLLQPFVHLALNIQQTIKKIAHTWLKKVKERAKSARTILNAPLNFFKKVLSLPHRALGTLRDKSSAALSKLKETISESIGWIKNTPQAAQQWGISLLGRIEQKTVGFRQKLRQKKELSHAWTEKASHFLVKSAQKGMQKLSIPFALLKQVSRTILTPWVSLLKKGKEKGLDFFEKRQRQALLFFSKQKKRLEPLSAEHLYAAFLERLVNKKWPLGLQRLVSALLRQPFFLHAAQAAVSCLLWLGRGGVMAGEFLVQGSLKCKEAIAKAAAHLQTHKVRLQQLAALAWQRASDQIRKTAFFLLYHFLLFVTMALILFSWGVEYAIAYGERLLNQIEKKAS